jgi:CBS domain-containing protein
MLVQEIMTTPVVACQSNETLNVAAQKMWDHDCGAIPIVNDKGKLVGIVTDRDVCMAAYTQARPLHELPIHIAMSKEILSVRPEQDIAEVEELMTAKQVRRIPVVDADGKPIAIVSISDIIRNAVRPAVQLKGGVAKVMQTLASLSKPRNRSKHAA